MLLRLLCPLALLIFSVCCYAQDTLYGFSRSKKQQRNEPINSFGGSIVSLTIMSATDMGFGYGLAIETPLNKKGKATLFLPVTLAFMDEPYSFRSTQRILIFTPGIKFYPGKNKRKVRYAFGPHLCIETGNEKRFSRRHMYYTSATYLGVMVNNTLNMFPTEHLYLGTELGIGVKPGGDGTPLAQLNFRVGYRF